MLKWCQNQNHSANGKFQNASKNTSTRNQFNHPIYLECSDLKQNKKNLIKTQTLGGSSFGVSNPIDQLYLANNMKNSKNWKLFFFQIRLNTILLLHLLNRLLAASKDIDEDLLAKQSWASSLSLLRSHFFVPQTPLNLLSRKL